MSRRVTITFDAIDPPNIAKFWAAALGYQLAAPPHGFSTWGNFADANDVPADERGNFIAVEDTDGDGPCLLFLRVPEDKSTKNRMHLDIHCGIDPATTTLKEHRAAIDKVVAELVEQGASEGEHFYEGTPWTVLTDPEGNEFCVV
jgi:hypothetical protein